MLFFISRPFGNHHLNFDFHPHFAVKVEKKVSPTAHFLQNFASRSEKELEAGCRGISPLKQSVCVARRS